MPPRASAGSGSREWYRPGSVAEWSGWHLQSLHAEGQTGRPSGFMSSRRHNGSMDRLLDACPICRCRRLSPGRPERDLPALRHRRLYPFDRAEADAIPSGLRRMYIGDDGLSMFRRCPKLRRDSGDRRLSPHQSGINVFLRLVATLSRAGPPPKRKC